MFKTITNIKNSLFKNPYGGSSASGFSSYWNNNNNYISIFDTEKKLSSTGKLLKLSGYKKAISNFVKILTKKEIEVKFSTGEQSYTDGRKVVISSNLNDKNLDRTVGLALHEASHIMLSDFSLLRRLDNEISKKSIIDKIQKKYNSSKDDAVSYVTEKIGFLLNWIEDRRIDNYIYTSSPGYHGYYEELYNYYFRTPEISKILKSEKFRKETWKSYQMRICNFTNTDTDLTALKNLKTVYNIIDVDKIDRLQSSHDALNTAYECFNIIENDIDEKLQKRENNDIKKMKEEMKKMADKLRGQGKSTAGVPGLDGNLDNPLQITEKDLEDVLNSKEIKELLKKLQEQKKFLEGDISDMKALSKENASMMDTLSKAGVTLNDSSFNKSSNNSTPNENKSGAQWSGILVRKLTQELVDSGVIHGLLNSNQRYSSNLDSITKGITLGRILGNKLKTRDENKILKFTRQHHGKIDNRLIPELGFNNESVFSKVKTDIYPPTFIHLSVDMSGSMKGKKWENALTTTTAIAKACSMISNIRVVISFRGSDNHNPVTLIAYDSSVDVFSKIPNMFIYLTCDSSTPEGLCFESILDTFPTDNKIQKYFINISDGEPYHTFPHGESYTGSSAQKHTAEQVRKIKNIGAKILSYFVEDSYSYGSSPDSFKRMYGKDSKFINITDMTQIAYTMNKKFLEK